MRNVLRCVNAALRHSELWLASSMQDRFAPITGPGNPEIRDCTMRPSIFRPFLFWGSNCPRRSACLSVSRATIHRVVGQQATKEHTNCPPRKMDVSIRIELLVPANWCWDDAIGPSVQFSLDGQSFLLAQQSEICHLFLDADRSKIPLAVLPDRDRQQFTDHLLVEIGDALEGTSLP